MTHKSTLRHTRNLLEIMATLRSPEGCPWDAEQTPESLAPYIIEEACELVDAIEVGDIDQIRNELGDLLLQVVFQAQIFSERAQFAFDDVSQAITEKMLRRHPHVFEDQQTTISRKEIDRQWEVIKSRESSDDMQAAVSDQLPSTLPALQYSQKLISRAHTSGRQDELHSYDKLSASHDSIQKMTESHLDEDLIGQLLFSIVNLAYNNEIDAESALRKKTRNMVAEMDK